jgi:hypothetical protein
MNEINKTFTNKIEDIFLKILNQNKNDEILKNNSLKKISKKSVSKKISIDISLKNIDDFKRNFVLDIYYLNKVTSQNILNEITFFA